MDPVICCLLGICCPPATRREKVAEYLTQFGIEKSIALDAADDLIARIDQSHLGAFLKGVVAAVKEHL